MRAILLWAVAGPVIVFGSFFGTLYAVDNFGVGPQHVTITEMTYGSNCGLKPGNFTAYAATVCNQTASCIIEDSKMSDPAPGCSKNFSAKFVCYRYGPVREVSIQPEVFGKRATLSCQAG